jgi:TusE/DsrC/DsvC family sulfur relay protein
MSSSISLARDNEGYLFEPEEWNESVARLLAAEEGLELDKAYWGRHQVAPDVRHVVDFLVNERDVDKKTAKKHLFRLFPYGYVKQACKIAGMLKPRAWSTG